jgi:hypothetical protein
VVYIPSGYVHAAECGAETSMHVTLGIHPSTWNEMLDAVVHWAAKSDDALRHALPLGFMKGGDEGIVNRAAQELRRLSDPAFLKQVLERFREERVKQAPLDISGQVQTFFAGNALRLDDRLGVRPTLYFTLRRGDDTVTLNVGTRTITFPGFFTEAVEFALSKPLYAIRDLPGDLEDEERIALAERLFQESVVVRI